MVRDVTPTQRHSVPGRPGRGGIRSAIWLGRVYVGAAYGVIASVIFYLVSFGSSLLVLMIRGNCAARAAAPTEESWLYGTGVSPVCQDGIAGEALALLIPLFELIVLLILIQGPPAPPGVPLPTVLASKVRSVFGPLSRRIRTMELASWDYATWVTPGRILFSEDALATFRRWVQQPTVDMTRMGTHRTMFLTIHEVGHLSFNDVLYSRGADRALPIASAFIGVFFFVAMPLGAGLSSYPAIIGVTLLECVAVVLATRYVMSWLLTNIEYLADYYAASHLRTIEISGSPWPGGWTETTRFWLRRSHPSHLSRQHFVHTFATTDFLWCFLATALLLAVVQLASVPDRPTTASLTVLTRITDVIAFFSLMILGLFGGVSARRAAGSWKAWIVYGISLFCIIALFATQGFYDIPRYTFDVSRRLMAHDRPLLWPAAMLAPGLGVLISRRFLPGPGESRAYDGPIPERTQGGERTTTRWQWTVPLLPRGPDGTVQIGSVVQVTCLRIHQTFVILAATSSTVFGFVLMMYALDTGIISWVHVGSFLTAFLVPFMHCRFPLSRALLLLDSAMLAFYLTAAVVLLKVIVYLRERTDVPVPGAADREAQGTFLMTGPDAIASAILNGDVFEVYGDEINSELLGVLALASVITVCRWIGQHKEARNMTETIHDHA